MRREQTVLHISHLPGSRLPLDLDSCDEHYTTQKRKKREMSELALKANFVLSNAHKTSGEKASQPFLQHHSVKRGNK